jgi:hypothetical protein
LQAQKVPKNPILEEIKKILTERSKRPSVFENWNKNELFNRKCVKKQKVPLTLTIILIVNKSASDPSYNFDFEIKF